MPEERKTPALRATLHHLALCSPEPAALADFYGRALGLQIEARQDGWFGQAKDRRLFFLPGPSKTLSFAAFAVDDAADLAALRMRVADAGLQTELSPTDLFEDALCVRDPDGNRFVFGTPGKSPDALQAPGAAAREARLQHVVFASRDSARLAQYYQGVFGFELSDVVVDQEGGVRTSFLRCSHEHHSLAVFQASGNRLDHHCYEAGDWGLIRDWGDHMAQERIPLTWGPGRHGPGNNLFIFVHDRDGNWIEISAELEIVQPDRSVGAWPHEERTLNSWGQGLLRS
ncbi:VOC family protein [Phenylobacterium montanum]|uniref:VOC family protein n=1 Tax=Phenylobacterium montanum TaxID=2823693 RepID=A0A975IX53_9CAUL|nr:VOC family protein [Caulobacter sp. S6]QUD90269.1 VOC family protein [Caulobacter sp. S6]